MPENDTLVARIAALEATVSIETANIKESLSRIETKVDKAVEIESRVTKIESDINWFKKIGAPLVVVVTTLVSSWLKSLLGQS